MEKKNLIIILIVLILALVGLSSFIWFSKHHENAFLPCNPNVCGGYPQNVAAFGLKASTVSLSENNEVRITLNEVKNLSAGTIASHTAFEVYVGNFTSNGFNGGAVGQITTDDHGNFNGTITTDNGTPYKCDAITMHNQQFILNSSGVRSEFYSNPQIK